jgi:NADH-quinone oxidoreductase subunit E
MLPQHLKHKLQASIEAAEHPRELVVDILFALQEHYGYLNDEAVSEAAGLLDMTELEIDELATFYTFIYREPVGRYVIHVCDSVVCWMEGHEFLLDYLCRKLNIQIGQTTPDGLFTVLPVCCIGYCDRAPAILINRKAYGPLTPEKLDDLLTQLKANAQDAAAQAGK